MLDTESEELLRRFPDPGTLADEQEKIAKAIHAAAGEVGRGVVPLTTAELRVLRYLPTHLSFQAIAEELFVSRNTVKTQAIAIYRKLGVSSRGDAVVARRLELGLLEDSSRDDRPRSSQASSGSACDQPGGAASIARGG